MMGRVERLVNLVEKGRRGVDQATESGDYRIIVRLPKRAIVCKETGAVKGFVEAPDINLPPEGNLVDDAIARLEKKMKNIQVPEQIAEKRARFREENRAQ